MTPYYEDGTKHANMRLYALTLALLLLPTTLGPRLISEAEIPTDEQTWRSCCDHRDCHEAQLQVRFKPNDKADVAITSYQVFELDAQKVMKSKNGRSYFCRYDVAKAPSTENVRCVFYGRPSYVRR